MQTGKGLNCCKNWTGKSAINMVLKYRPGVQQYKYGKERRLQLLN